MKINYLYTVTDLLTIENCVNYTYNYYCVQFIYEHELCMVNVAVQIAIIFFRIK